MNDSDVTDEGTSPENTLEELAYRFGRTYDSYLATEAGLTQFWSSSGKGVVSYACIGRYLHFQGGLLCNPAYRESLRRETQTHLRSAHTRLPQTGREPLESVMAAQTSKPGDTANFWRKEEFWNTYIR